MRRQVELLELAEGYFASSVLFALLRLNVFETLGLKAKSAERLAKELDASSPTLHRLLKAGVVLGFLESTDAINYQVVPEFAPFVTREAGDTYLGDWLRNMDFFRDALSRLDVGAKEGGPTVDPFAHIGSDAQQTHDFTLAMHNYAAMRGRELAKFLDTGGARSLLDLGCGPGTYAFNLASVSPDLAVYLLDLPGVLEVTREIEKTYSLSNPVHYLPVDVNKEEIPGTYDMVLVSNTLHMLGERNSRDLINRLYETVADGGSLVVQAQYLKDDGLGPRWPVLLDLIQLCITEEGRNHSVGETKDWLAEAGFTDIEFQPMGLLNTNSFLRGYKR